MFSLNFIQSASVVRFVYKLTVSLDSIKIVSVEWEKK
jgi:hypothetical protein